MPALQAMIGGETREAPLNGVLVGKKVVIFDRSRARDLYFNEGFYGKFFTIGKAKIPIVERELELSLMEALYLMEKGKLVVKDARGGEVSLEDIKRLGRETYENFDEVYAVYRDLREKGLVVKSGMKFGATFAVYRLGPGLEHAPFLVHVLPYDSKLDPIEIVRAGRLSHSVRKKFIVAYVDHSGRVNYLEFKWLM